MDFKKILHKERNELRTHCTIIQINMQKLLENREWKSRITHKEKSLKDLQDFANKWSNAENSLANILDGFLNDLNTTLTDLDDLNTKNSIPKSRDNLREFLKESEPSIRKIKDQLDYLKTITV
jgi:hypothetical protein